MDLFEYMKEKAIHPECCETYSGMAFDGCNYYFLIPCMCKIIKYNQHFSHTNCFETDREYSCICYDYKECCFWAGSRECNNKIFKLDSCLKEIDCIKIRGCKEATGVITGIAYHCCPDTLLVSFTGSVVEVNKKCEKAQLKYRACSILITGVCSVCPYYIITAIKDSKQYIIVFDSKNRQLHTELVPDSYIIKSIIFNPCDIECKGYHFDILAIKKGCYPYVIKAEFKPSKFCFFPCPCNYYICKKCCDDKQCKPFDPCSDIVESVALIETALSHILNAEGEKLQKVLATTNDLDEILCANQEINKTIINATHLEHVLYAKLSAITDGCECKDYCNDCQQDCSCSDCWDNTNICTCDLVGGLC
ncbi:MAG: hypothetical protein RSD42_06795 [Oscillospiraceae bacterium]